MSARARDLLFRGGLLGAHVVAVYQRLSPVSVIRPPAAALSARADAKSATIGRPSWQQDVLGLDVAVNHPVPGARSRGASAPASRCGPIPDAELRLPRSSLDPAASRLDIGHDVIQEPVGLAESNSGRMCGCCSAAVVLISTTNRSAAEHGREFGLEHLERDGCGRGFRSSAR